MQSSGFQYSPFRWDWHLTLDQLAGHCRPSGFYALKQSCASYRTGLRGLVVDRLAVDQVRLLSQVSLIRSA